LAFSPTLQFQPCHPFPEPYVVPELPETDDSRLASNQCQEPLANNSTLESACISDSEPGIKYVQCSSKKSNWVSAGLRQKATSTSWSVGIDWKVIEDIQENKLCWIDKWTVSRGSSKFQGLSGWHGFRSTYAKLTNIYFKSAEVFWCNPVSNDGVSSVSKF